MAEEQEENLSFILSDMNARVRVMEGKYNLLGERLLVVNQNMIQEYRQLVKEIKDLERELKTVKKEMFEFREAFGKVIKETQGLARKEDVKVLEKYINLWDPMKFVTEKDVLDLIRKGKPKEEEAADGTG